MFKALVNNELSYKAAKSKCPHCESDTFAKCGSVKVNRWEHKNSEECDSWCAF